MVLMQSEPLGFSLRGSPEKHSPAGRKHLRRLEAFTGSWRARKEHAASPPPETPSLHCSPRSASLQTCALPPGCLEIKTKNPPSPRPSPGIPVLVNIPSVPLSLFRKERIWNETNRLAAHRSLLGGQGGRSGQG